MTDELAIPNDPGSALGLLDDPKLYMERTLGRAIMWLSEVEKVEEVVASKALASAYEVFIREKELGHDAQLAAAEIIRRCERRIGQLVRDGQERGEIRRQGQSRVHQRGSTPLKSPTDYVPEDALRGGGNGTGIYDITDGGSDEQFEEAISTAKAEGNLSRANVVRKLKGQTTPNGKMTEAQRRQAITDLAAENLTGEQIGKALGVQAAYVREEARRMGIDIPADRVVGKTKRIDPNRIVAETVSTLEGVVFSLNLLGDDLTDLNVEMVPDWVASLSDSIPPLKRFIKALKEINP